MAASMRGVPRKRRLVRLSLLQGQFVRASQDVYTFTYCPVNISVDECHVAMVVQGIFNRLMSTTKAPKEPSL